MCNIAGYVGDRPAAPLLIEMMLREEGFGGGYFSGIATIHEGKIYYAKLTGDMKRLVDLTEAASLPGNIGIIHSRSNSGGGDEWAHPFVGVRDGETKVAYVANGAAGSFAAQKPEQARTADALLAEGYEMLSRVRLDGGRYLTLSDGMSVHMSDVMCQMIMRYMDHGASAADAMSSAFCGLPSEIVGLLLSLAEPDRITFSRINYPMFISFASHGAYLGTTAIAFPEDCGEPRLLPACSSGDVFRDHYTVKPYTAPPATVAAIDARVMHEAYGIVCDAIRDEAMGVGPLCKLIRSCFAEADCCPDAALVYDILDSLNRQGKLEVETRLMPGAREDLMTPRFFVRIKNA